MSIRDTGELPEEELSAGIEAFKETWRGDSEGEEVLVAPAAREEEPVDEGSSVEGQD